MENDILFDNNGSPHSEKYVKKYNLKLYKIIETLNINYSNLRWACKVYNYIHNITEFPKCPICNSDLKFVNFNKGYRKFCSAKCSANSPETKENKKITSLKNYDTEYPTQNIINKQKKEETNLKKYGTKYPIQNKEVREKQKSTLFKNYGVVSPFKSSIIRERAKKSVMKNWDVENVSQSKMIIEKKKNSSLKKFGTECTFQSETVKNKSKITTRNIYGVDYYVQTEENKLNIKNEINEKRIDFWTNYLKINNEDIKISGSTFIINNLCEIHKSFNINRYNLYNRTIVGHFENICTICNPISENSSIKENEIKIFIENELNLNTKKIKINKKEIDINVPTHNSGIEFDGLYWHSDKRKNSTRYHLDKTELCKSVGIDLLHIFEDEWTFKKEIVKSIIKSKLNIFDKTINSEDCEIIIPNSDIVSSFLEDNNIQGNIDSEISIGLTYNNELVSLMIISKKRSTIKKDGEYEILRYCNKLNTNVINSINKLLNYFINEYHPKSILVFVDRRYSQGELYEELGFTNIKITKPNYWYFKAGTLIREHRFNYRKEILIKEGYDINKTEFQIMAERGYLKIYDCGSIIFEKLL